MKNWVMFGTYLNYWLFTVDCMKQSWESYIKPYIRWKWVAKLNWRKSELLVKWQRPRQPVWVCSLPFPRGSSECWFGWTLLTRGRSTRQQSLYERGRDRTKWKGASCLFRGCDSDPVKSKQLIPKHFFLFIVSVSYNFC